MTINIVFGKLLKETNTSMSKFIERNLLERLSLMTKSKTSSLQEGICNSKLFYKTFVEKKYQKPLSERKWDNYLGISLNNLDRQNIYVTSLKSLEYKKFCEFKFKILHNILPCGKLVSKWSPTQPYYCQFCLEPETIVHMLYTCSSVKNIWLKVSEILQLEIQCKHVILGLYSRNTTNNNLL